MKRFPEHIRSNEVIPVAVTQAIHRMTVDEYVRIVRDFGWNRPSSSMEVCRVWGVKLSGEGPAGVPVPLPRPRVVYFASRSEACQIQPR